MCKPTLTAFAVLDILGYGKLMGKEPSIVVKLIQEILKSAPRNWVIQKDVDRVVKYSNSSRIAPLTIEYLHFSDTLLVWLCSNPDAHGLYQTKAQLLETVSYAASVVLATFMSSGIPMRGAVGVGDAYVSKDPLFFTGKELCEAFKYEKVQNWAGCALTPSAAKVISQNKSEPFFFKYRIPVKEAKQICFGYALNWVSPLIGSPELIPPWERMINDPAHCSKVKIDEAKKFFNSVASKNISFPIYLDKDSIYKIREKVKPLYD